MQRRIDQVGLGPDLLHDVDLTLVGPLLMTFGSIQIAGQVPGAHGSFARIS